MDKKQNQINGFFLIIVILSAIATSCTPNKQIIISNWGAYHATSN